MNEWTQLQLDVMLKRAAKVKRKTIIKHRHLFIHFIYEHDDDHQRSVSKSFN